MLPRSPWSRVLVSCAGIVRSVGAQQFEQHPGLLDPEPVVERGSWLRRLDVEDDLGRPPPDVGDDPMCVRVRLRRDSVLTLPLRRHEHLPR